MNVRTLRIALVVSLIVNLFVIGGVVGGAIMWSRIGHHGGGGGGGGMRLRQAGAALSPVQRDRFRETMRATMRGLGAERDAARAARGDVARLLAAAAPDRAAIDAALTRGRAADFAIRARIEAAVTGFALALPPAERAAMAVRLGQDRAGRRRE